MIKLSSEQLHILDALALDDDPANNAARDAISYVLAELFVANKLTIQDVLAGTITAATIYLATRLGFKLNVATAETPLMGADGTLYSLKDFMDEVSKACVVDATAETTYLDGTPYSLKDFVDATEELK